MPTHISLRVAPKRLSLVRVPENRRTETFGESVRAGLSDARKTLSCRFLYDEIGSGLFEQICDLPEYYLTRAEDAILADHADAMVEGWLRAPTMIELGSGSSTKTRRLLSASLEAYDDLHYVPIDVSATILEASSRAIADDYDRLRVTGYVGDYRGALGEIAKRIRGPKLIVFLGSSLGNYDHDESVALLRQIASAMKSEDRLLLGTDLAKDKATLEAAYDDAQGVSAAFNLNLLARINRELDANFRLDSFRHEARYEAERGRVEMHLVSLETQDVHIPGAGIRVSFAENESIHTENSHKYTIEQLGHLAESAGLAEESSWTDAEGRFRVQRWKTTRG